MRREIYVSIFLVISLGFKIFHLKICANLEPPHDGCAPSEDSDQPGHPPCLIRVFSVRSVGS